MPSSLKARKSPANISNVEGYVQEYQCAEGQLKYSRSFSGETNRNLLTSGSGISFAFDVKKVAIVGAGPSGLAAAKHLLAEEEFDHVDIFEQQAEVGGVWNYNTSTSDNFSVPQTSPDVPLDKPTWPKYGGPPVFSNPMYDELHTNIPKTLMCFPGKEFPSESLLFPIRQDVQQYIVEYADEIRDFIEFSTQVQSIRLLLEDGRERWAVTCKSMITSETIRRIYDAVVIASGHYAVPFVPNVKGIAAFHETHPSIITRFEVIPEA